MREGTNSGVKYKYPDPVIFAFNANLIEVEGANLKYITIVFTLGGTTRSVSYDAYGGKAFADISEYIQSYWDGTKWFGNLDYQNDALQASGVGVKIKFSVKVFLTGNTTGADFEFDWDSFAIWGALEYGKTYNAHRTLYWWQGYPFAVGMYADKAGTVAIGGDGAPAVTMQLAGQGVYNLPLSETTLKGMGNRYLSLFDISGTLARATFDTSFDLTFRYNADGTATEVVRVKPGCPLQPHAKGVYLRWVDSCGFVCHWLFQLGDDAVKTEAGTFLRPDLSSYSSDYGYQYGAGRRANYTKTHTLTLGAALVDSEHWDMLLDLAASPLVDMFMGYDSTGKAHWVQVTCEGATLTKTAKQDLQDFVVAITLPQSGVQQL